MLRNRGETLVQEVLEFTHPSMLWYCLLTDEYRYELRCEGKGIARIGG
jgi:hypothetical protein